MLDNLSFSVEDGQAMLLSGASGSGKSTLLHCMCGVIPRNISGDLSGFVLIDGRDIKEIPPADLPYAVAIVFQSPRMFFSDLESELAFVLENLCFPPDEIRQRVDEALTLTNLQKLCHANPAQLSGGQMKMAALASALVLPPRVLLLDEIGSGLDSDALDIVRRCIGRLQSEGCAVVASEHMIGLWNFDSEICL